MNNSEWEEPAVRWFVHLLLIVVLLSSLPLYTLTAQTSNAGVQEEQDYAFAFGLYQDKLYQLASDQFQKFIDQYPASPKRPDAVFLYAECRFDMGEYAESISVLKSFAREFPRHKLRPDALFRLGEANFKLHHIADAIPFYKEILESYGENSLAGEAAYWIGEAYFKTGDVALASHYYTISAEKYPSNRLADYALYSLGWAAEQQKDFQKAIGYYQRLLDEKKQSDLLSTTAVRIGECYSKSGLFQKSIDYLSQAKPSILDSTEKAAADYCVAEDYYNLQDYLKARLMYEAFCKSYPSNPLVRTVTYSIGWTYLKTNDFTKAASVFGDLAAGLDDVAYNSLYRKAQAVRFSGDTKKALELFNQVVTSRPNGEYADNALYESGMIDYEQKDYDDAIPFFDQVTKKYPSGDASPDAYRMLGESYIAKKNYESAAKAFHAVKGLVPANDTVSGEAAFQEGWVCTNYRSSPMPQRNSFPS